MGSYQKNEEKGKTMILEWRDIFSVGIEQFDEDHKQIFKILNDLEGTSLSKRSEKSLQTLIELEEYTQKHFNSEEEFMKKINFPLIEDHKGDHSFLIRSIKRLRDMEYKGIVFSLEISDFLKFWIIQHILGSDREYAEFNKEKSC